MCICSYTQSSQLDRELYYRISNFQELLDNLQTDETHGDTKLTNSVPSIRRRQSLAIRRSDVRR